MPRVDCTLGALKLDLENVRIRLDGNRPAPNEPAALARLIEDQEDKLANLAEHIQDNGLSPGEPLWVIACPDEPARYIVLEGNRRVAALKLMDNPQLSVGTSVEARFRELAREFADKPMRQFAVELFPSRVAAQKWIDIRHMSSTSGVGIQPWRSIAKAVSTESPGKKVRRSVTVLRFLDDGTRGFGELGAAIHAKATTFDRVFNHPSMEADLGVAIDRTGSVTFKTMSDREGRKLLRRIITTMASRDFKFAQISDSEGRKKFLRGFLDDVDDVLEDETAEGDRTSASSETTPSGKAASKPAAVAEATAHSRPRLSEPPRKTLAPSGGTRAFKVGGTRLKRMYGECRTLELKDHENALAVLFRVFIELSSETLLTESKVAIPTSLARKTSWSDIGIPLKDKVAAVLQIIDTPAPSKELKAVRIAYSGSSDGVGSIDTLHAYVHNVNIQPTADNLRQAWDIWENYLRLLHGARP